MKTRPRLLALLLACSAAILPTHAHEPGEKLAGPNQGRVLTQFEPHVELLVTAERKVRLTFLDEAGKATPPPSGASATLVTGDRAAPTTLAFAAEDGALLSTSALPEGQNLPAILTLKTAPDAAPSRARLQLNLATCGECDRPEYTCTCAH